MGRAGVAPHTCPDIAAAAADGDAGGVADVDDDDDGERNCRRAAPAPAQPTQMDIAQFSKEGRGPTNNATAMRNRRFQKSLSALEMEHGRRVGEKEAVLPLLL